MSLEVATYVSDLQPVNPPSTDPTNQGDDHLRLLKQVLQNQFPGPSRAWAIPNIQTFSASPVTITKPMDGWTLFISTASGATTVNLPGLTAGDAGWCVHLYKTSTDVNPMLVFPPSGNIVSGVTALTRARRCVPGVRTTAIWTGSQYFLTRANPLPVGAMIDFWGTVVPPGYEFPNGQTLASVATNYPEYNAWMGSGATPDLRGYAGIVLDNLGGAAAGRLPNGQISGSALGAVGGIDASNVTIASLQAHAHNMYQQFNDPTHSHTLPYNIGGTSGGSGAGQAGIFYSGSVGTSAVGTGCSVYLGSAPGSNNQTTTSAGGGGLRGNLQPSIMLAKIMVVE